MEIAITEIQYKLSEEDDCWHTGYYLKILKCHYFFDEAGEIIPRTEFCWKFI